MPRPDNFIGILIFCLLFNLSHAQQSKIDSLKDHLRQAQPIEKIKANYALAFQYERLLPDTALAYYEAGLKLSEEINNDTLIAKGYNGIGNLNSISGKYIQALDYLFKALKIFESKHLDNSTIYCLQSIGIAYNEQGIFDKAMDYSMQALGIAESLQDKYKTAVSMIMVGSIYYSQHNYDMALNYFQQALFNMEKAGDKQGISDALNNVALIYEEKKDFNKALEFHLRSLKMAEELKDKRGMAATFHNIALVYKSLEKFPTAIKYLDSCVAVAKELDDMSLMKKSYNVLSELYAQMGKFDLAYQAHLMFSKLNDTLLNTESKKQFAEMSTKYESEKKDNEIEIKNQKIKRQAVMRNAFIGGFALVLVFLIIVFSQKKRLTKEKMRSDKLLLNILPSEVAEELKLNGHSQARTYSMVTVMFIDFWDFTEVSEKVSAELLVAEIDYCFSAFDNIIEKHGVEKIKTVGDAYMCVAGLPVLTFTHAADIINAAIEIRNFMLQRKKEKEEKSEIPFQARIGIHTGSVVAGIVGIKKFAYDIWGDTVNIASRMESSGEAGKVNISGATFELVKDKFKCMHRGKIQAKNKGEIDMYFVEAQIQE